MNDTHPAQIHVTDEATGFTPAPGDQGKPITVIGTNSLHAGFDATCRQQARNARCAPGVTHLVLQRAPRTGYGAPVGCVLTSPTHGYPGPVGVDIKCSMSFLQLDLRADQVADKPVRRAFLHQDTPPLLWSIPLRGGVFGGLFNQLWPARSPSARPSRCPFWDFGGQFLTLVPRRSPASDQRTHCLPNHCRKVASA